MDQIEAVAKVLEACASLMRRMACDGASDIGAELVEASREMENAARRLLEASHGRMQDRIG